MTTNELTKQELAIISFGLQGHIDMLEAAITAYEGDGMSARAMRNARLDTQILLDKIEGAINA